MNSFDGLMNLSVPARLLAVVLIALAAHGAALLVRRLVLWLSGSLPHGRVAKLQTLVHLLFGTVVFSVYFLAVGVILAQFGISLTAYLATASVIGLAVGFGSQSIVQDVISGLTVILSDLLEIGDMVEIAGQTGIVQSVGMRFTVLRNSMGANVYIPNRSLASMINYPRGYIRCLVDIELAEDEEVNRQLESVVERVAQGVSEQFPAVMRRPFEVEGKHETASGKRFLRVKFRLWPGRGAVIETSFKQEVLSRLIAVRPDFKDTMLSINYEVERA